MDFNKLKVYGFPRHVMNYKLYNPMKIKYLQHKQHGYFETPKTLRCPELRYLVDRYKQRIEYEKHMNPKGIKQTWTSNFPKVGDTIDFVDPKIFMMRSGKQYEEDELKFLIDKNLSKYEVIQFMEKLYKFKVKQIHTAILPGEVRLKYGAKSREFFRTPDRKKALIKFGFPIEEKYRKLPKK